MNKAIAWVVALSLISAWSNIPSDNGSNLINSVKSNWESVQGGKNRTNHATRNAAAVLSNSRSKLVTRNLNTELQKNLDWAGIDIFWTVSKSVSKKRQANFSLERKWYISNSIHDPFMLKDSKALNTKLKRPNSKGLNGSEITRYCVDKKFLWKLVDVTMTNKQFDAAKKFLKPIPFERRYRNGELVVRVSKSIARTFVTDEREEILSKDTIKYDFLEEYDFLEDFWWNSDDFEILWNEISFTFLDYEHFVHAKDVLMTSINTRIDQSFDWSDLTGFKIINEWDSFILRYPEDQKSFGSSIEPTYEDIILFLAWDKSKRHNESYTIDTRYGLLKFLKIKLIENKKDKTPKVNHFIDKNIFIDWYDSSKKVTKELIIDWDSEKSEN